MKKAFISIAIVTYNNSEIIEETLKSIIKYTKDIFADIFVIDNNSVDYTVRIVKENFPKITVIEHFINIGFGAAHNLILEKLESKYHVILNPDIRFKDNALKQLYDYMEKNSDVALTVPKFLNEDMSEQYTPKLQPNLKHMISSRFSRFSYFRKLRDEYTLKGKNITEPINVDFCSGCLMFIKTEVFKMVGGFDERYFLYSEDADLTRMTQKYGRTIYNPHISVIHLWERGYLKSKYLFLIQIKSMFMYLWKWRKSRNKND